MPPAIASLARRAVAQPLRRPAPKKRPSPAPSAAGTNEPTAAGHAQTSRTTFWDARSPVNGTVHAATPNATDPPANHPNRAGPLAVAIREARSKAVYDAST